MEKFKKKEQKETAPIKEETIEEKLNILGADIQRIS